MGKVNMSYANYKIYGVKSPTSNKNLLSDMLNELADTLDFDMRYLHEEFSEARSYMIDEEDIGLLAEILEAAKSRAGKRIRCRDFSLENADAVEFFINSFLELAQHNNTPKDVLFKARFRMNARTDFVVLKRDLQTLTDTFDDDLKRYFFAPTDFLSHEDDELTKEDIFIFLAFMCQNLDMDRKAMRGIYWCFVEERQSRNRDNMLRKLHAMSTEDTQQMVERIKHSVLFESRLDEDEEYAETISEFARIEGGGGKLQDRKKVIPLAKKLCEIMDRYADGFMTTEKYACGEPDFKKSHPAEEDIFENLMESGELLDYAIRFYNSFKVYRQNYPLTPEDESMIETLYRQRFGENMF